ncbi:MAG: cell division protein FtsA [Chloroflexota bacterium]
MENIIVGIDVGTTKICTLIGQVTDGLIPRIVGVGVVPSRGLRKGVIVNVHEATEAIARSVDKAEKTAGIQVERAYVGISGDHITGVNSRGVVAISRGERGVVVGDIERALDAAQAIAIPHNQEVLHVIPRNYNVDGQEGIREPLGMHGFRLEVEAHIITGARSAIQNLVKCIQALEIEIDELVLDPLASGEAALTETEREMGVVLADIGGGTTDIGIFIEGSVWHTVILPVGGHHLTNDIAVGLRAPYATAEEIKKKHGHAQPARIIETETLDIAAFGEQTRQKVPRRFLAEIIEARTEEIFELILKEIKRSGYDGLLPAGLVLCGGTADLNGIQELGREILGLPVRVGAPRSLRGLVDVLNDPAYATGVGLLLWGIQQESTLRPRTSKPGVTRKITQWLRRAFLPR